MTLAVGISKAIMDVTGEPRVELAMFEKDEIKDSYSYEVEIAYLEWEGLISRLKKYMAE